MMPPFFEYSYVRGLRTKRWKYIERTAAWPSELFDLQQDPQENNNLIANLQHAETLIALKHRLHEFFERAGAPPCVVMENHDQSMVACLPLIGPNLAQHQTVKPVRRTKPLQSVQDALRPLDILPLRLNALLQRAWVVFPQAHSCFPFRSFRMPAKVRRRRARRLTERAAFRKLLPTRPNHGFPM